MSFTTVPTFTPGQLVSAADFNTYIRDNLAYLATSRQLVSNYWRNGGSNYSITGTSFANIDAVDTKLRITLPATASGRAKITVHGLFQTSASVLELRISQDGGTAFSGDATHGDIDTGASTPTPFCFVAVFTGLTLASHTFDLQGRVLAAATGAIINAQAGVHMIAEEI